MPVMPWSYCTWQLEVISLQGESFHRIASYILISQHNVLTFDSLLMPRRH